MDQLIKVLVMRVVSYFVVPSILTPFMPFLLYIFYYFSLQFYSKPTKTSFIKVKYYILIHFMFTSRSEYQLYTLLINVESCLKSQQIEKVLFLCVTLTQSQIYLTNKRFQVKENCSLQAKTEGQRDQFCLSKKLSLVTSDIDAINKHTFQRNYHLKSSLSSYDV